MSINLEETREFENPCKPIIYILPKESAKLDKTISDIVEVEMENFEVNQKDKGNEIAATAAAVATAVAAASLPLSLGIATPIVGYLLGKTLDRKNSNITESEASLNPKDFESSSNIDRKELKKLLKGIDLSDWDDFVDQIYYTDVPKELDFPPGHPIPGRFYRVHPLKDKINRYIPEEIFDYILYKERESELIKILVDLGATDICIQEISSNALQGIIEGKTTLIGAGGGNIETKGEKEKSNSADRIIKLNPKNWSSENFKSDEYSWLPYEPDWESIVHARLKGGCISSSIELTSDTSFSISAQLGLTEGLLENLGSLGGGGDFSRLRKEKKRFEVRFIDI